MKSLLFFTLIYVVVSLIGCKKDENSIKTLKLKACFSIYQDLGLYVGDTIKFTNCSEGATSFIWDFGDGNISKEKLPWHIYKNVGNYKVKLYITNMDSIATDSQEIILIDKYYTDLHDSTFSSLPGYLGVTEFRLDIDKDGISDVKIATQSLYLRTFSENFVNIKPLNNYKISYTESITDAYSNCDSNLTSSKVMIPKVFKFGDTISIDDKFTKDSLMIYYNKRESSNLGDCESIIKYSILESSNYYLAFSKESGTINKVGWLKITKNSSDFIVINSIYYSIGQSLIINK